MFMQRKMPKIKCEQIVNIVLELETTYWKPETLYWIVNTESSDSFKYKNLKPRGEMKNGKHEGCRIGCQPLQL